MPQHLFLFLCLTVLVLSGCAGTSNAVFTTDTPRQTSYASARTVPKAVQCVPYAREKSGIQIMGDAYTWWDRAAPHYNRGHTPQPGSVLVLAKTNKLRYGHLAVVREIITPRQINVTHSNWGNDSYSRRVIYDSMRVEDISARNDWSNVRFWNPEKNVFGFPYASRGFIYQSPWASANTHLVN